MLSICSFSLDDFADVRRIYQQGIDTGLATFELEAKNWQEWNDSMHSHCRLVAKWQTDSNTSVVGWAALSPVSSRQVYKGVAEVSIYVDTHKGGRGIGSALLAELVLQSEKQGIWTLQAGIFSDNHASIGLHKKHGFKSVGVRERLAQRKSVWKDVLLMERRSGNIE